MFEMTGRRRRQVAEQHKNYVVSSENQLVVLFALFREPFQTQIIDNFLNQNKIIFILFMLLDCTEYVEGLDWTDSPTVAVEGIARI